MGTINVNPQLIEEQRRQLEVKQNHFKSKVEFNEKNYLNLRLNKGETKREVKVRILPVSATNGNIFLVLHTHSLKVPTEISRSGFKSFICLNDEHLSETETQGCPLCNKSKELINESNKCSDPVERKALFKSGKQYESKQTFIVRVIERGHEDEGVKFWRFNAHSDHKGIYDQLMALYDIRNNESQEAEGKEYNIFDLYNGKDIVITLSSDNSTDKTSIKIADAGYRTPLSKNEEQALAWINDEKTWSDIYASKSFEYLQIIADEKIPYYSKEEGKWVVKEETETGEDGINNPKNAEITSDENTIQYSEEDLDLPF